MNLMEKQHKFIFPLIVSLILVLGLVSFALCIAAEFEKSKKEDLRLDGEFCYLPRSAAFGLGIAALVSFGGSQVVGNLLVGRRMFFSGERTHKSKFAIFSLVLSWISFGVATIILSTATSMNRSQPLGEGWLNGECYMVKNGVFTASAILILITLGSTIASALITREKMLVEQGKKVHAQG